MFGGSKPNFGGTPSTSTFGGFGNALTTPAFGQSAFGKPAAPSFGQTPAFGGQQATPSLFGQTAAPAQQTGGLFGATTSTAFGSTTTAPTTFGGFSQPQQNTSIFGAAAQAAPNTSLFGQSGTTAFGGAVKPSGLTGFGQTAAPQPSTSLFGQQAATTSTTGFGGFGQAAATTTNVFGSGAASAFGQPQATTAAAAANPGSSVAKYQPTVGTDTLMKSGQPSNISTKQHCITAMKEYEHKSLEEIRVEDYLAGRKGPQAGSTTGGFFGATTSTTQPTATGTGLFGATTQQTTGLFGQSATTGTENKGIFGQNTFGQTTATTAFGAGAQQNNFMAKPFGATNTAFGGTTTDASNPFGQKPAFGQTQPTGLFGQTPAVSTAPAFGQAPGTGFAGFGAPATNQQPSLFGATNTADANKPAFGIGSGVSTANTGFGGFGAPATSTAAGGGLFGAKPATGFGATPAFGATSQPNTGFGNFSMSNTSTTGTGLFNSSLSKPAATGFGGFGAQPAAPLNFNAGNTAGSLFGNTAAKPGGLFGGANTLGTATSAAPGSLFGGTSAFGASNPLSGGFGTLGGNTSLGGGLIGAQQQQATIPIHQQILAKVTSPYGDTPIFKDLKRNEEADATRATNPAAQQALLDSNINQFKVEITKQTPGLKVKPITNASTRRELFDGVEQLDQSIESFNLKPNAKRLSLKPKSKISPNKQPAQTTSGVTRPAEQANHQEQSPRFLNTENANGVATDTQPAPAVISRESGGAIDTSRRESWLHPNNLQKVRQQNLQAGSDNAAAMNNTLTELVPRKPIDSYRPSIGSSGGAGSGARLSISTIPENPFEDQPSSSNMSLRRESSSNVILTSEQSQDSLLSGNRSMTNQEERERLSQEILEVDNGPHPTGITLKRIGYYTIPSLDDLKSYLAEDRSCVVPNFTIGREGYGNVYFSREMDVAGLNLDEIVHFRNKEIIVYPDDENKPPIGEGLNREAQVTLDKVWPLDKSKHEAIKDPQRLSEMDWEGKLRRVCDKNDTRFIDYRPETGSWVFRVKHFSKYGLSDSDEDDNPTDPKKVKLNTMAASATTAAARLQSEKLMSAKMSALNSMKHSEKLSEAAAARLLSAGALANSYLPPMMMDETAEFMFMDKTQYYQNEGVGGGEYAVQDLSKPVKSPSAALAQEVGCNEAHKVQLMKSSLFFDDDVERIPISPAQHPSNFSKNSLNRDYIDSSVLWKEKGGGSCSSDISSQFDFGQENLSTKAQSSVKSIFKDNQLETSSSGESQQHDDDIDDDGHKSAMPTFSLIDPEVPIIKELNAVVPMCKSFAYPMCTSWVADLGINKSFSFKTCFGPQNSLIVPTTEFNRCPEGQFATIFDALPYIFKSRASNDFSSNLLQHVKIISTQVYDNFNDSVLPHLEIQLGNAQVHFVEGSECPWLQSDLGTDLIVKHLNEAIKLVDRGDTEEYAVSVWSLLLALWGDHEQLEDLDEKCHFSVMFRRNLLSEWLENTLIGRDLLTRSVTKHTYLEHMLNLLKGHRVIEACELAFTYDDTNLSLLLAQLSSGPVVRRLVEDQLASWNITKTDKHISVERLKMLMMVAGVPLMNSTHGPLNILENLNWINVLALELWYFTSPTASITDALYAYDKCYKSEDCYAEPPLPHYDDDRFNEGRVVYDLRYHILQLFSKRSHHMETLLNPATHTSDPMDYRLSWLLLQTLEALGYDQCPRLSENQIHVGFASQLENNGLWEWAIFVLLNIKDQNQREIAVQNLLSRYVTVSEEVALNAQEKFIINRLGVPEKWVDYAKAIKAGSKRKYRLQAKYLLKAHQWALAHEIIYEHIAPDAIIKDNLTYLKKLLMKFEQRTNARVPNWANQGQIFLDYIDIVDKCKRLETIGSDDPGDIAVDWENIKPQLAELCSRINMLPCPTPKHRLCQAEIAQRLSCLLQGTYIVCPTENPCMLIKIALERLPLPQEYAKRELRTLLDNLVQDISKVNLVNSNEYETNQFVTRLT